MKEDTQDLLQGTLDLLVLKALSLAPMHGWGVAQRLQLISREVLQVNQGSLYPALHRLQRRDLSTWRGMLPQTNRPPCNSGFPRRDLARPKARPRAGETSRAPCSASCG